MKGSVASAKSSNATSPCVGRGESQARSPVAVKTRLSRATPVQVFSISAFPQGSRWWERPPRKGGEECRFPCHPFPSPVPHQRAKQGGRSHHQHPSRKARRCAVRRGDTRGAASLRFSASNAGNPCCPASGAAFRGSPTPQRRGSRPLREKRCGSHNHVTLRCHPHLLKG